MKQEPVENDLIDAWLSGQSPAAARRALGRAVAGDSQTAAALVEQSRIEAALRLHLAPSALAAATRTAMTIPARVRPACRWWLAAAGAAGVAAAVFFAWPSAKETAPPDTTVIAKTAPREMRRLGPREVKSGQQTSADPKAGNHSLESRLNQFWLNGETRHQTLKLGAAVQRLCSSIEDANVLKRPELKSLNIEIQKPEDMEEPQVIFSDTGRTAGRTLRLIAAQAGAKISYDDSKIVLVLRKPVPPEKGIIDTAPYRVGPAFLADLTELTQQPVDSSDMVDPFLSDAETPTKDKPSAVEMLAKVSGLRQVPWGDWTYDPLKGKLTIHAAPAVHKRIANVLEALNDGGNPGQISMEWKFIDIPAGLKVEDQILDNTEFQAFTRGFSQMAGVDLMTMPSIISGNRSWTNTESTKEINVVTENGEAVTDFTGIRIGTTAALRGEVMVLDGTTDIGIPKDAVVQHTMVDFSATLQDNQTAVFLLPPHKPGRQIIGTVTARPITAAGAPALDDPSGVPSLPLRSGK
jgi:hypothetical protein